MNDSRIEKIPLRTIVSADDHIRGPVDAPLELVMYGDYECVSCGHAQLIVRHLESSLGDELRFVFRNFPRMQAHSRALDAAKAAEAAAQQGKFWAMYEQIYENQASLGHADLISYAALIGLELDEFLADMRSPYVAKRIETDHLHGTKSGVSRTPTFFVNGYRHDSSWSFAALREALLGGTETSPVLDEAS